MKLSSVLVSSFLALSTIIAGCSSSSGGGGSPSVFCSASFAGSQICYGYTNLTSDQQNAVTSSCKSTLQGTIVSACPTSGLLGCCKTTTAGYNTEECYYGDDAGTSSASADQMACTSQSGTWSTSQ
jgi:hypothetical protein